MKQLAVGVLGALVLSSTGCLAQLQGLGRPGPTPAARSGGGGGGAGAGLETEYALTDRFCATLEQRLGDQAKKLAAAQAERDPRRAFAMHGQVYRDSIAAARALQVEFDAEYKRLGDEASRLGVASTSEFGYGSGSNSNHLWHSDVSLGALAAGSALMVKTGMPFAKQNENGIRASEVQIVGSSACKSQRKNELTAQVEDNVRRLERPFDLGAWGREEPLPIKPGALLHVDGGVATAGASPTLRWSGGRPIYRNCRQTNRLDRIDANGVVHYQEVCQYAGGRSVVVLVTVKNGAALLPKEVGTIKPTDYLAVTGRLLSAKVKETRKGEQTTTTHTIEVEPLVVTEVARKQSSLFRF